MGTRSRVIFKDNSDEDIAHIHCQFDGYPEGRGKELATYLSNITITNGVSDRQGKSANGIGCLAALFLSQEKGQQVGNTYLIAPSSEIFTMGEEYAYIVRDVNGEIEVTVVENVWTDEKDFKPLEVFKGNMQEMLKWINNI